MNWLVYFILCLSFCSRLGAQSEKLPTVEALLKGISVIDPPALMKSGNGIVILSERGPSIVNSNGTTCTIMRLEALSQMAKTLKNEDIILLIANLRDPDVHKRYLSAWLLNDKLVMQEAESFRAALIVYCRAKVEQPMGDKMQEWLNLLASKVVIR